MAENVTIQTISESPTALSGLNSIMILNGSDINSLRLDISGADEHIDLGHGQTLTLTSHAGSTLPDLELSGVELTANIVKT
tara:strand:- start:1215 stop:1457 length:243 start_codon:yes stop_codon:yes gene_type:complete